MALEPSSDLLDPIAFTIISSVAQSGALPTLIQRFLSQVHSFNF